MKLAFVIQMVYSFIIAIFLYNLGKLNKILLSKNYDNPIDLLSYNNNQPLWYFFFTIVGIFIALGFLIYYIRNWKESVQESISLLIIGVIGAIVSIGLLIVYINNPILKAILLALVGASFLGFVVLGND
jgi:ABC-type long-subunit fatty acid transport system fused permease/ATPase subunit